MARAGNHLFDISKTIQDYAEGHGFSVVREMVCTTSSFTDIHIEAG